MSHVQLAFTAPVTQIRNGAAVIRPPGHHCEVDRAMGFCFLGNVPIACHYAFKNYGLKR